MDLNGNVLDHVKTSYSALFFREEGMGRAASRRILEQILRGQRPADKEERWPGDKIKAVAISSQRGTYINLDKDGKPLRPAITWLDERMTLPFRWAPWYLEAGIKAIGWYGNLDKTVRRCRLKLDQAVPAGNLG